MRAIIKDNVRKLAIASMMPLLVTACASQQYWYKSNMTEQKFNQDNAQCQLVADSGTPVYIPKSNGSTTTYHSGNVYSNGQNASYSGTSTTYDNSVDLSGLAIATKRKRMYQNCMVANGYKLVSKDFNPGMPDLSVHDASTIKKCTLPNGSTFNTAPSRCRTSGGKVHN